MRGGGHERKNDEGSRCAVFPIKARAIRSAWGPRRRTVAVKDLGLAALDNP
jgi:hypothetical protein